MGFFKNINKKIEQANFKDTKIQAKNETLYINPTIKFIAAWVIFAVIILVVLLIVKPFGKKEKKADDTTSASVDYVEFERNEYPRVNAFVESYLNALTNCDMNVLSMMVVDPNQFSLDELNRRKQYILSETNPDCYTKPGLTEGSYVVYAVVNTQVNGVSVMPLSLHKFYLIPNENGGFYHDNTAESDPEIAAYLAQIEQDPDVVELYEKVNEDNEESANQDETLRAFYEQINSGALSGDTATDTATDVTGDTAATEATDTAADTTGDTTAADAQ